MNLIIDNYLLKKELLKTGNKIILLKENCNFEELEKALMDYPRFFYICNDMHKYNRFRDNLSIKNISFARVITLKKYNEYQRLEKHFFNLSGIEKMEFLYGILQNVAKECSYNNIVIEECKRYFNETIMNMSDMDFWLNVNATKE